MRGRVGVGAPHRNGKGGLVDLEQAGHSQHGDDDDRDDAGVDSMNQFRPLFADKKLCKLAKFNFVILNLHGLKLLSI
jgi:hypothetical protein